MNTLREYLGLDPLYDRRYKAMRDKQNEACIVQAQDQIDAMPKAFEHLKE